MNRLDFEKLIKDIQNDEVFKKAYGAAQMKDMLAGIELLTKEIAQCKNMQFQLMGSYNTLYNQMKQIQEKIKC